MTSTDNMWVNVAKSQFHLRREMLLRALHAHRLVIEGREALLARLSKVNKGTRRHDVLVRETNDGVDYDLPLGQSHHRARA